jgi:hypothetical protein
MKLRLAVVVFCSLAVVATHVVQGSGAPVRIDALRLLSYLPEYRELIFLNGAWAVEWRPFTGSFITSPGGAPVYVRGRVLIVYKKMPDGNWKCFRVAGIID